VRLISATDVARPDTGNRASAGAGAGAGAGTAGFEENIPIEIYTYHLHNNVAY
jgi:hypothetical protein